MIAENCPTFPPQTTVHHQLHRPTDVGLLRYQTACKRKATEVKGYAMMMPSARKKTFDTDVCRGPRKTKGQTD